MGTPVDNPSQHTAYMRMWRALHPGYARKYQTTPEQRQKSRQRTKRYREKNLERTKASKAKCFQAKKDYYIQKIYAWREKNIEKYRAFHRMNRALRRALVADSDVTLEQVIEKSNYICGICNKPIEDKFHIDHIIPISRGGSHTLDNLQMAHPFCNRSKGDTTE